MDRFSEIKAFISVAELGSFVAAADRLELSRAMVTKLVSALESRLGVRLMHRTTRKLSLTEAGEVYLAQAGSLLTELDDLDTLLMQGASLPSGRLRVSAPVSFGRRYLGEVVSGFHALYADVEVELSLSDRRVDLVEEGFDVAIRVSNLPDSTLVARKLASLCDQACASPGYIKQYGMPQHPDELIDHQCLIYTLVRQPNFWEYTSAAGDGGKVRIKGPMRANNGDVLVDAAINGLGIILQPEFLIQDSLQSGELIPVLPDYKWNILDLSAVYPVRRHVPGKVRAFVDYLVGYFKNGMG